MQGQSDLFTIVVKGALPIKSFMVNGEIAFTDLPNPGRISLMKDLTVHCLFP